MAAETRGRGKEGGMAWRWRRSRRLRNDTGNINGRSTRNSRHARTYQCIPRPQPTASQLQTTQTTALSVHRMSCSPLSIPRCRKCKVSSLRTDFEVGTVFPFVFAPRHILAPHPDLFESELDSLLAGFDPIHFVTELDSSLAGFDPIHFVAELDSTLAGFRPHFVMLDSDYGSVRDTTAPSCRHPSTIYLERLTPALQSAKTEVRAQCSMSHVEVRVSKVRRARM